MSLGKTAYYTAGAVAAHATNRFAVGRSIFADDWDVCIILDSCRVDLLRSVISEYLTYDSFDSARSVGSITTEWLSRTFVPENSGKIAQTTMVSATPHTQTVFRDRKITTNDPPSLVSFPESRSVTPDDFEELDEVWRYDTDDDLGCVPPRPITDAAIRHARDGARKLVVHYLQPHEPFLDGPVTGDGVLERRSNVWDAMDNGDVSKEDVWESYRLTLERVLEDVALLVRNVDGEVLITADHGNAFGEWGVYGHPFAWPQPEVRRVPWVKLSATDERTHDPVSRTAAYKRVQSEDVDEQLAALGYR